MKQAAWLLIGLMLVPVLGGCQMRMTEARRELHRASFDEIWQIVKDKHYDPDMGGVDWSAVRDELRPRIDQVQTDEQARQVMQQMLAKLKLSHYAIYAKGELPPRALDHKFVPPLAGHAVVERIKFGNLPELPLRCHAQLLASNVEYFYLSMFINPPHVQKVFKAAIVQARDAEGFILDLRHNPGGLGGMAMGIGNVFIDKPDLKLGDMQQRDFTISFVLNPQAEPYTKPLAILIDEGSASTSEILAGGLQDIGRARIFGTRSAGMALPSMFELLPNGDTLQYAVANYVSTGGATLEGKGVTPDELVEYKSPHDLPDPVVEAAVKWIKAESNKNRKADR